jgi:hypothetical protein
MSATAGDALTLLGVFEEWVRLRQQSGRGAATKVRGHMLLLLHRGATDVLLQRAKCMDGWMDGWMCYTGLARQSTTRKALYEAKAGGMNHDAYTSHSTMRVTGTKECMHVMHATLFGIA